MSRLPPNEDTFWEMWGEATLPCAPHADAQDTQLLRRKSPLTLSHRATVPASERLQEAEKEDTTGILGHSRRRERVEWPGREGRRLCAEGRCQLIRKTSGARAAFLNPRGATRFPSQDSLLTEASYPAARTSCQRPRAAPAQAHRLPRRQVSPLRSSVRAHTRWTGPASLSRRPSAQGLPHPSSLPPAVCT